MTVVDLSHPYANGMPRAGTIPEPHFSQVRSIEADGMALSLFNLHSHVGTHLDAPSHFILGGRTIDEIPLDTLVGPAVAVAVSASAGEAINASALQDASSGLLPGDALLIRTGWGPRFGEKGYLDHPYLTSDAANWVVDQGVRMVGVDTVTPDLPYDRRSATFGFPVHHILLGAGVLIVENLNLEAVVGRRFQLVVGPLCVLGADGAPARVLALFDE